MFFIKTTRVHLCYLELPSVNACNSVLHEFTHINLCFKNKKIIKLSLGTYDVCENSMF